MTILDCSVTGCMYNEANCCHKGNIKVEGEDAKESEDTCCGSFDENTGDSFKNLFKTPERGDRCAKNVTGDAPKNIEVACCAANCVFNKEEKCSADHIGIAGGNACNCRETECASFCCG